MLRYFECALVAALDELSWPSMTEIAITQRFDFLIRLRDIKDSRPVKRALQLTLDTTRAVAPSLICIRCLFQTIGSNVIESL